MKYTQEQVERILSDHGFILCDVYKNGQTHMFCTDFDGYKYSIVFNNILRNKTPLKIHSKNPYALENIDTYFKNNNITTTRLSTEYINNKTSMVWKCECGEEFSATWNDVVGGKYYCNKCARSKRFDGFRDYIQEVRQECEQRGYILLTDYIHRSTDKFKYICKKHVESGVQYSTYDTMINCNRGCKQCGIDSRVEKQKTPEWKLKELAESKGFIYAGFDYDNEGTSNNKVNIHIICPYHIDKGIQRVKYHNLKKNTGKCRYCMGYDRTKEDLQKELDELHGTIEILEYDTYMNPITVQCRVCGHIWSSIGPSLTNGRRCPNCNKSLFEIEVMELLNKWNYINTSQYIYLDCRDKNPLPFDFYLPEYNILIEVDGEGHYKPIPYGSMTMEEAEENLRIIQKHDAIKTQYCKDNNIPLIRIPYWERKNLEQFLIKQLNNVIYKKVI